MLLQCHSALDRLLLMNVNECHIALSSTLSYLQFITSLTCNNLAPSLIPDASVSRNRGLVIPKKTLCMHPFWLASLLFYKDPGSSYSTSSLLFLMSVFIVASIPLQSLLRTYLGDLLYLGVTVVHFLSWVVAYL